jgi:hypothetical protein
MTRLNEETLRTIREDANLQLDLAKCMNVGQMAIISSVNYNRGRSIAKNWHGMHFLVEKLNKPFDLLVEDLDAE